MLLPVLVLVLVLAAASGGPALPPADPRSSIVVRETCSGELGERDLALFANGTLRLREGPPGAERLVLHEIPHDGVETIRRRLDALDLAEGAAADLGPRGDWTASCVLEVEQRRSGRRRFRYGELDTTSPAVAVVRGEIQALLALARDEAPAVDFPPRYRPAVGDRLERNDGELFEIVGFTDDGKAVELEGVAQPLSMFVERSRLRVEFRRLLSSASAP